ncbi:MAG TPA: hypothetical protein VHW90_09585 [Stellaceae bacterium]|jgi:hypothetical protein|nr:hypothetical protein [Stellaceae bacterium]
MPETVTLEFLGAQFERLFNELRTMRADQDAMRDDIHVLTSIVLRHENTLKDMLGQMRTMVSQHQRFSDRLRRLEEQQPAE